jgi:hypothetical protein
MIDVGQAEALIAKLRDAGASASKGVDPALPLALSLDRARRDVSASFAAFEHEPGWFEQAAETGLIGAALASIAKWISAPPNSD